MWFDGFFAETGGQDFDSGRPAFVLIHGAGSDHSVWARHVRGLAEHGNAVLAFDLPGHGRSAGSPPETIAAIADLVADLLDAAGLERATIAGHSMGALAALDFAARFPERTRKLVLFGAAARMPVHPDLLAAATTDLPKAAAMIAGWGHARVTDQDSPGPDLSEGTRRLLERSRPGVLAAGLAACDGYDGTAAAQAVQAPATLVIGGNDRMCPAKAGLALAGLIPRATPLVLDGAGHMLLAERPEAALDALL
jgi:pimeloyl-ACP methyl ester carboxylesterase